MLAGELAPAVLGLTCQDALELLGLNVDAIVAIVLGRLLGGPLGERLSAAGQQAVGELQRHAEQAIESLLTGALAKDAACRDLLNRLGTQAGIVAGRLVDEWDAMAVPGP